MRPGNTNIGVRTPVLEQSLQLTYKTHKSKSNLIWGSVNICILSALIYDLSYRCPSNSSFAYNTEIILSVVVGLNVIYHGFCYLKNATINEAISVTPQQKRLLGIRNIDSLMKVADATPSSDYSAHSPLMQSSLLSSTPMNLSATSWRSTSVMSPVLSEGSPFSTVASSWSYYPGSGGATPNTSRLSQSTLPMSAEKALVFNSSTDIIESEHSLSQYLQEYEMQEKCASASEIVEQPKNILNSFWKNSVGRKSDISPISGRYVYQLATPSPVQTPSCPGGQTEEHGSPSSVQNQSIELWKHVGVDVKVLTQWTANLRMWISQTVLERLVREIAVIDEAFIRHGLTDVQVGAVGLERLKKTAQVAQVVQNIPTLPLVVPFLEITSNQEYLVSRIKELAKGGAMSQFRWNSGGSIHGKEWEEHLPTDSAVVMHLLGTYLDSQLPALPHNLEGRPFTSQYFVKSSDKPPKSKKFPVIQEIQLHPPHYVLVVGEEKMELAKGRNNLFHTILLFLHQMKVKEHGMLGRVNLGSSGINVLWVIDS